MFYCCDKIPGKNNLKEERFISVHDFRGLSPLSAGSLVSGEAMHHGWKAWQRKASHLMAIEKEKERERGGREREKEKGRGAGDKI